MAVTRYTSDKYEDVLDYWNGKDGEASLYVYVNTREQFKKGLKDVEGSGAEMTEAEAEEAKSLEISETTELDDDYDSHFMRGLVRNLGDNGFTLQKK